VTFGYTVLGFGTVAGIPPLAGNLNFDAGGGGINISYSGGSSSVSNAGDLDVTATATGGTGSYTYAWTLPELDDQANKFAVTTTGTTNAAQYNTARITNSSNLVGGDPPPQAAIYQANCVINDGVSSITLTGNFAVALA
jgi:FlaG/FlaF family flagellin (archaellin)